MAVLSAAETRKLALARPGMHFGGQTHPFETAEEYLSDNPATGKAWAAFPIADATIVDLAVKAALAAFEHPSWGGLTPTKRGYLLYKFADVVEAHKDELAELEVRENGKLLKEMLAQMVAVPKWLRYFGGLADKIEGRVVPLDRADVLHYTRREPIGVVGIVVPWNSPILLTVYTLAPALAAGNTVVIKPSEVAAAGVVRFAELATEAGLPPGVVNVVTGLGPTGSALVNHPQIQKVCFTGSTETGKAVGAAVSGRLARVTLELGGKSPNIVFADANLTAANAGILSGIFSAGGQSCIAGSRALIQSSIYDSFVEGLVERTRRIVIGDPMDPSTEIGPVASRKQYDRVDQLVENAKSSGARVLAGGQPAQLRTQGGFFYEPTIIAASNDTAIAQTEVFGPVLTIMRFEDDEDAIRIANDTPYGLAAGLWTSDIKRAHRIAARVAAGTVWVNMYRASAFNAPFGGFKQSGVGFSNGIEAINDYFRTKAIWCELGEGATDPFVLRI